MKTWKKILVQPILLENPQETVLQFPKSLILTRWTNAYWRIILKLWIIGANKYLKAKAIPSRQRSKSKASNWIVIILSFSNGASQKWIKEWSSMNFRKQQLFIIGLGAIYPQDLQKFYLSRKRKSISDAKTLKVLFSL